MYGFSKKQAQNACYYLRDQGLIDLDRVKQAVKAHNALLSPDDSIGLICDRVVKRGQLESSTRAEPDEPEPEPTPLPEPELPPPPEPLSVGEQVLRGAKADLSAYDMTRAKLVNEGDSPSLKCC